MRVRVYAFHPQVRCQFNVGTLIFRGYMSHPVTSCPILCHVMSLSYFYHTCDWHFPADTYTDTHAHAGWGSGRSKCSNERVEERDFDYVTVDQVLPYDLYNYVVLQVMDSA